MPKSLKPMKKCLNKNVCGFSQTLDSETYTTINQLCINYGKCRANFFNRYCGINGMLRNFRTERNQLRNSGTGLKLVKQYQFLNKHWVYSLFDTFVNVHSMWSNVANQIRKATQDNSNIDDNEQHYLFFILKFNVLWHGVLIYNPNLMGLLPKKYQLAFKNIIDQLTPQQIKHAQSYLRRLTRRYKPKPHALTKLNNKSMTYDENMYRFPNDQTLRISSNKNRHVIVIHLTSPWHYAKSGNLQIILNRPKKRIEIHKCIQTHTKLLSATKPLGIDKGLATLISCSTDHEYGINFSYDLRQEIERMTLVGKRRNREWAKYHGLSNCRYQKQKQRHKAYLTSKINHAIYQMLLIEQPSMIVKEDLKFVKEKVKKQKGMSKKQQRLLNTWTKGILNKRIEYLANKFNIPFYDVNPAYTSQYCPYCHQKFLKRYGKHNELVFCKNCGELNANTAAAKNILQRYSDPEIQLYTPYKKIKQILDQRC